MFNVEIDSEYIDKIVFDGRHYLTQTKQMRGNLSNQTHKTRDNFFNDINKLRSLWNLYKCTNVEFNKILGNHL